MDRLFLPWRMYWLSLTDAFAYPWLTLRPTRLKILTLPLIYALLAVISTGHFAFFTLPAWQTSWQETWKKTQENWPADLQISYENGVLITTPEEPLVVAYPALLPRQSGWPEHLARIDTTAVNTLQDSLVFLNRDTLTTQTAASGSRSVPLTEIFGETSWTLNKEELRQADGRMNRFFAELSTFSLFAWLGFHWLGLLLVRLLGLLLYTWIAQTIYQFMGLRMGYWRAYGLGAMLLLPAETVQTFASILYPQWLSIFWWAWLAMALLIGWLNRFKFLRG